jgi:hypothetical protein
MCVCGDGQVARQTRDGWVCVHSDGYALACPLPFENGHLTMLIDAEHPLVHASFAVLCRTTSTMLDQSHGNSIIKCVNVYVVDADGSTGCVFPNGGKSDVYIADLYDCIEMIGDVQSVRDTLPPGFSDTTNGVCCMNRGRYKVVVVVYIVLCLSAFTCIQPHKSGPNPTDPRWYYNSVSNTCQQFLYDPHATEASDHSPNNFLRLKTILL